MLKSKGFPQEIRVYAYVLHARGFSHRAIHLQLTKISKKKFKCDPPSERTINSWSVEDKWKAQDEATKAALIEKRKGELVDQKSKILDQFTEISDTLFSQFTEQVKEGVRVGPVQAVYALMQLDQIRLRHIDDSANSPDVKEIVKAAVEPLFEIIREVMGQVFADKEAEILERLEGRITNARG